MIAPFSDYHFNPQREPSKKQWIFEGLLQLHDIVVWLAREKALGRWMGLADLRKWRFRELCLGNCSLAPLSGCLRLTQ